MSSPPPALPAVPPEAPRAFATGCLGLALFVLAVAAVVRAFGIVIPTESDEGLGPLVTPIIFASGCTVVAMRPRQLAFRGALQGRDVPKGFVDVLRFVILGAGAIVPAVVAMTTDSYLPFAIALVPLAAMAYLFPRTRG